MLLALTLPALAQEADWCDSYLPPEAPDVVVDDGCQSEPRIGTFNPTVEWQWLASSATGYNHVMSTPTVGNLTDDNNDGVIDDADVPDILFVGHGYHGWSSYGYVTLLSGDSGAEHWVTGDIGGYSAIGGAGTAIGDLEGDGSPDFCVTGYTVGVICAEYDGTLKWAAGTPPGYGAGYPTIGDMDGDGCAEVAIGAQIFDCTGALVGQGAYGDSDLGLGAISVMADMDVDGQLELVAGNAVYERDGTLVWSDGGAEGYPAVGDFDADGLPEVVRTGNSYVTLTDDDGTILWTVAVYGGGRGGPPTVADFDGDDAPEVGVAGAYYYTVYEGDGSILWSQAVIDTTSNATGSSVFDFEGDGRAEVVYADEYTLFVFDGATGGILLSDTHHDSGTWFEYPVIADVDQDGSSEIVLPSNTYRTSGDWAGITVIGDLDDSWMPSRPIWNQHSYHITNVNDDGSIPAVETENWLSWNNFRSAGLATGPSDWQVDLEILGEGRCAGACADEPRVVEVWLQVGNAGLADAVDAELTFYRYVGNAVTLVGTHTVSLASGEGTLVGPYAFTWDDWGDGDLWVSLSPVDVNDCDWDNQEWNLGWWPYPEVDADGDGYDPAECGGDDCDDTDPYVNAGAAEVPYDGADNDCDESTPDDDLDADGYPHVEDCDDEDPAVNPDADDVPDNGVDEDCDGLDAVSDGGDDTGVVGDGDDPDKCGCASGPGGGPEAGWLLALAAAVTLRRRRGNKSA
ncbi:MAG: hypothetical protein H6739_24615 [Alphaproteobacteria bacterium]|nr:hypothetical protein [Alphaproteobacteria bacterium]